MGGGPVNDRPTQAHLAPQAGATPHKYNTVLYSKINRHRVPAFRPRKQTRSKPVGKTVCTARLCHSYATIMPCSLERAQCLVPLVVGAEQSDNSSPTATSRTSTDGPQSPDRHMDRRPCQATSWDTCRAEAWAFLHGGKSVTLRPKMRRARGSVVPIPGRCRSRPTVVERAPSPRNASESPVCSTANCELHYLWNEAHEKCCRRLAHIHTHQCRTVAARQLGRAMPRQDCRYHDRFDSG